MKISKLCAIVFIKCTSQRGSCRIIRTQYPHSVYCLGTLRCSSHSSSFWLDAASLFSLSLRHIRLLKPRKTVQATSMLNWKFQRKKNPCIENIDKFTSLFSFHFSTTFEATKDLYAMTKPCGHTKQDADKKKQAQKLNVTIFMLIYVVRVCLCTRDTHTWKLAAN